MAATYMYRSNISNAINKVMATLNNGAGSGVVVRVYRIYVVNISTAAVTGGMGVYVLDRYTGTPAGGAAVTLIKHNTASANVPAQVTALDGDTAITGTLTSAGIFRVFCRSNDEISPTALTNDELGQVYPMNVIWDGGYGDSNVEPIVLRESEGLRLYTLNAGTFGASTVDLIIEMTIT